MTKQQEAAIALADVHREQDISHEQTVLKDKELMQMIEEAREDYAVHKNKQRADV